MIVRAVPSAFALVVALTTGIAELRAQTSVGTELRIGQVSGLSGYFLYLAGSQATNVMLETSGDLKAWTNVFQVFRAPGTNPVYRVIDELQTKAHSFWRALPGEALPVLEERWVAYEVSELVAVEP